MLDSKTLKDMTGEALDDLAVRVCAEVKDQDTKLTATKIKEIRDTLLAIREIAQQRLLDEQSSVPLGSVDEATQALAPFQPQIDPEV